MPELNFETWIGQFKSSISTYSYYVDFEKVFENIRKIEPELNALNTLISSTNIESDFRLLLQRRPSIVKCIPILIAVRNYTIFAMDETGENDYDFSDNNMTVDQYTEFMEKTGLFSLLQNHLVSNLVDYVTGIEVGLSSNGRKNRGGHLMEDLVEKYIMETGLDYHKEMTSSRLMEVYGVDINIHGEAVKASKRFDFVIRNGENIYLVETNFYASSGSKLNETARSYRQLGSDLNRIENVHFIWITDGEGWTSARMNLRETYETLEHVYCIGELERGILSRILI